MYGASPIPICTGCSYPTYLGTVPAKYGLLIQLRRNVFVPQSHDNTGTPMAEKLTKTAIKVELQRRIDWYEKAYPKIKDLDRWNYKDESR